jgi:hypothetical protein
MIVILVYKEIAFFAEIKIGTNIDVNFDPCRRCWTSI